MWADPETTRFISGVPSTPEESWHRLLRNAGHWAVLGYGFWVIRDRVTGRFMGEVGFKQFRRSILPGLDEWPEAGWVLAPWARGQGLATEAAHGLVSWADTAAWPVTVCMIDPDNAPSRRIAAACGFRERARAAYKGKDVIIFDRPRRG